MAAASASLNVSNRNKKGDFRVVVGIDFGTDGSGVAWALNDGSGQVFVDQEMNDNSQFIDTKTKTNILLDEEGNFIAFGREATEKYIRQFEDDESASDDDGDESAQAAKAKSASWLYFSQFKMALYKAAIKKQTAVTKGGPSEEKNNAENQDDTRTDIVSTLTAANGKSLPSRTVFVAALRFMREHAFKMFARAKVEVSDSSQVKWVLTVPAIWSDQSKGLMERWAMEAGLVSSATLLNQLVIAYEPDCASISIQNEIKDYKKLQQQHSEEKADTDEKQPNAKDKARQYLQKGEKYLLLDLGGGTADIACHEVIDDFTVKEVYEPSGGAWGSSYIDKHFVRLLRDVFPKGWLNAFQTAHPAAMTTLLNNFRRAKETFYARDVEKRAHNIRLPVSLIEFMEDRLERQNELARLTQQSSPKADSYEDLAALVAAKDFLGSTGQWALVEDKLEVAYAVWQHLFDRVIDRVVDHCAALLETPPLKNGQCKYVCLVGGFSASKYLQKRVFAELGAKSKHKLVVIVPNRPSLSVVDGAVRLGLRPDYIAARVVRKTYGIKVNAPIKRFDSARLQQKENRATVAKQRYWNERAQQEYMHCVFHAFVRKGDEVKLSDKPKTTKFYASKKSVVGIDVYASEERDPLFVPAKAIARKDFRLPENWDIHQTFPISFFFGDTKIRVFADIDGLEEHEKEIHLDYEF